jgi:ADP-L-glycero-D-manno-heptose 6-epimerase
MIVITGSAGFIGSCLAAFLLRNGYTDLVLSDDFSREDKKSNLEAIRDLPRVNRDELLGWIKEHQRRIQFVFHLGARTDTTEFNHELLFRLNTGYSMQLFGLCSDFGIPIVYASSAATYGDGQFGFIDDMQHPEKLQPLNPYGESKHNFDLWVLNQNKLPPFWAGLKFFNVYGPNEYHKGRMASVIFHAYHQIIKTGGLKLFKSHNPKFADGCQLRDFIFVEDINKVCLFLLESRKKSGIFNLGSGKARSFLDLATGVFNALKLPVNIEFIDIPEDIREKYQYFTEADMTKLKMAGYQDPFFTLEEGIKYYISEFLLTGKNY